MTLTANQKVLCNGYEGTITEIHAWSNNEMADYINSNELEITSTLFDEIIIADGDLSKIEMICNRHEALMSRFTTRHKTVMEAKQIMKLLTQYVSKGIADNAYENSFSPKSYVDLAHKFINEA